MITFIRENVRKILVVFGLMCLSFGAGWLSKSPEQVVEEKVVEKVVEKIVEVEKKKEESKKIVKTTKKPDGTITTTVIDDTINTQTNTKSNETAKTTESIKTEAKPNYSAGVAAEVPVKGISRDNLQWRPEVGYRALGDLWVTGGYNIESKQLGVGVRVEF